MKTIYDALYNHIQQETTTLCTVWRMTRRDGMVMGFTDLDRDLKIGGVTYHASTGFTPSAINKSTDLSVDNLDVQGQLESDLITENDLKNGLYDYARIEVCQLNYEALPTALVPGQVIWHTTGYLGECQLDGVRFKTEVRSLTQKLSNKHGKVTSKSCEATLGDAKCKVDLTGKIKSGTVQRVVRDRTFVASALTAEGGYYEGGLVTFTGPSIIEGMKAEVASYEPGIVRLYLPPPVAIPIGATFTISPGCDKSLTVCVQRWNNAVNFRGFPHIPGTDVWQSGRYAGEITDVMKNLADEQEENEDD